MHSKPPTSFWNGTLARVLFWTLTFSTAAYASFYAPEIANASMPTWESLFTEHPNYHVVVFFSGTFSAITVHTLIITHGQRREDYLYAAQLTAPPYTFYDHFDKASKMARTLETSCELTEDIATIENNIRIVLDYIITLTQIWDSANLESNVIYRANIMEVVYFDEEAGYNPPTGEDARFFFPPVKALYSGLVYLPDWKLTTTTLTESSEPDKERKPIYFPFSLNEPTKKTNQFINNLKGAPVCVATKHYSYVENTEEIIKSADALEPTSEQIKGNLKEYYSATNNPAHSILSIPIYDTVLQHEKIDTKIRVKYVLNIYRNLQGLLFHGSKVNNFTCLLSPLTMTLYSMLTLREKLKREQDK